MVIMYSIQAFIISLLFLSLPAFAQEPGLAQVQQFTTENGLPSNGIKGLQWDESTGFLWMATEAGIVRFNGVDFRSFTKENTKGIASERMMFILRNQQNEISISDMAGNIFSVRQNMPDLKYKAIPNSNPYSGNYYLVGTSDRFFLQHRKDAIPARFSVVTEKLISLSDTACLILQAGNLYYNSISLNNPRPLTIAENNISSFFKMNGQVFVFNNEKKAFILDVNKFSLTAIAIENSQAEWLPKFDLQSKIYWETGMSHPILIENENAWEISFEKNRLVTSVIFSGIPSDALIRCVQYSAEKGLLFIGTDSKGLIVLKKSTVETKKRATINTKNRNSYYSQVALPNGSILTNEGDIINGKEAFKGDLPIKGKFTFYVSITNDSLLWYSQVEDKLGYACLHQYNMVTRETKIYNKIKLEVVLLSTGGQLFAASNNGIGYINNDSLIYLKKYPNNANFITYDIQELSSGTLAIATCAGVFRYQIKTHILDTLFQKDNACVRTLWKYKDYVFMGTYGSGFYIYKNGNTQQMPLDKNKYLSYAHCFVPDGKGFVWISTNRGLFKANLQELIDAYDYKNSMVYYHYFGNKDGMEMTELNGGCKPCALRLKNDIISFPSMDGLLWVNSDYANPVYPSGEVFIDEVIVDNKLTTPMEMATHPLPATTSDIAIKLAYSAWCNNENIYLEYQLNDTVQWKSVAYGDAAEIRFSNLPSGSYKLRIRKLNGFGPNNYSYKVLEFSIITPWYKRWWFYALLALSITGLFALYFRIRTNQYIIRQEKLEKQVAEKTSELQEQNEILEKNNSIKTRLISIISHDIVTPLKFVAVAGQNLLEKKSLMSEELQDETIREMTNTARELQLLSTNILNWIKYQNENRRLTKEQFHFYDLVNQVTGILHSMAKQKQLRLVNQVEEQLQVYQFFEPLKILIYNLLTNAINFAEKSDIHINAVLMDGEITITVSDQGVGMSADQIKNIMADQFIVSSANMDNRKGNGLGYLIIKDLIKMTGATLYIKSEKAVGTAVSVTFSNTIVDKSDSLH